MINRINFFFILILASMMLNCLKLFSQPVFSKVPLQKANFASYSVFPFYTGGVSFTDFNEDGWDDITLTTWVADKVHFYENHFGTFTESFVINTAYSAQYYSVWIDYDNDGDKDLFSISEWSGVQVFNQTSIGTFSDVTASVGLSGITGIILRGGVFGDFNNDGLLDFYLCAYSTNHQNRMFFQDQNGVFQNVTAISGTANGFKRSFHAVVLDYNNDGYVDMYVGNDLHDGNTLYKNNGDSTFSDVSIASGAYQELDAMGLAVGDFDGDLDLDIHITDRVVDSKLLRNNNDGTFTEVGTAMGLDFAGGLGWGNNFFDMESDGDQDLYVSAEYAPTNNTNPSAIHLNGGGGPFTSFTFPGDSLMSFSNAIGDLNNDRVTDIAVHNSWNIKSMIWENKTPQVSDLLTVKLEGCMSNRDAIGAKVYAYSGGSSNLYSTHGSQSFLGQNSTNINIPVLGSSIIDSIKVKWPLGGLTSIYNIDPNQTIIISECGVHKPLPVIMVPTFDSTHLTSCSDDSILLTINGDYPNVTWSSGESTDSIYISSAGTYLVTVTNQFGVSAASSPISIIEREYPAYTIESEIASCFTDGSIHLIPADSNALYSYQWSNQSSSDSLGHLNPGVYYVTITDQGECAVTDSVIIYGPTNFTPINFNGSYEDALCYDDSSGMISVFPTGGSAPYQYLWSTQETSSTINVPTGNYGLTISDSYNCSKDTSFNVNEPDQILAYIDVVPDTNSAGKGMISLDVFGGIPPYLIAWNDSLSQRGPVADSLITGTYQVVIEDFTMCDRTIDITVPNVQLTSLNQPSKSITDLTCRLEGQKVHLTINDNFLIEKGEQLEFALYDINGRKLAFRKELINDAEYLLNFEGRGVFLIKEVTSQQGCKVAKP